ncbi:uncharacterized protein LOC105772048 [Gossypium raimondii]|uniref:uncharacterized protein LOC105772048 n=1 Tax=Gossypium raimondii TaxID=29730 RepID=UPI00227C269C|nr:uncharacterized protein LOC105772048 [Gossypium raimondii]
MARWQILLSEFDIVYINQKVVKGTAIVDFLASRALEDFEPLDFDFPNEDLICVATAEQGSQEYHPWKLNFDGASNAVGNGIGAVLMSPIGDHYPFTSKLDFDCTNNMVEYEAYIMGIRAAIERKIKTLEVYGDSVLVIYQFKGEWETRDLKLVRYQKLVLELTEEFDDITFHCLPRDENQMADVLATLASMIKVNKLEDMKPIQMSIYETPAHYYNIEEQKNVSHPWYQVILQYVKNREYPEQTTENDKRALRRLAIDYVLDGEILYKRGKDQVYATSYANVTKSAVNKFLKKEIICRYRMPERIISDNLLNLNNSGIERIASDFSSKLQQNKFKLRVAVEWIEAPIPTPLKRQ